jgi:hypothetical protein
MSSKPGSDSTKPCYGCYISGLERSLWIVLGLFLFMIICLVFICLCYHKKSQNRINSVRSTPEPVNDYTFAEPPPYNSRSETPPPPYNSKMQSVFLI